MQNTNSLISSTVFGLNAWNGSYAGVATTEVVGADGRLKEISEAEVEGLVYSLGNGGVDSRHVAGNCGWGISFWIMVVSQSIWDSRGEFAKSKSISG